jgi:hypothetical protein
VPASESACRDLRPKLDCQIRMLGKVNTHAPPTHWISFASLSLTDPSPVPEFYRNYIIIGYALELEKKNERMPNFGRPSERLFRWW